MFIIAVCMIEVIDQDDEEGKKTAVRREKKMHVTRLHTKVLVIDRSSSIVVIRFDEH